MVDPSAILLQSFRYNQQEMALKVFQHYVVYFDNLSSIKQWLSDILCRACTGQGFTQRKLYTDEDSVIFQFQRCIGINGITLSRLSPDFLDRCLTLVLKQIPSAKRKDERRLWEEFEEARPRIFGAILDTLSKAMAIYPAVKIENLPRMADFAMWGEAVARALGHEPGEFLDAYRAKIGEQVKDILEENPIGLAILAFMENQTKWEGTPGELLKKLEDEEFVKEHKIDTDAEKWPKAANWLTKRIMEIETNLEHEGVKFATKRVKGRRVITLLKTEKFGHNDDEGEGGDMSGNGQGDGSNGKDGISHTKNMQNKHNQQHLGNVQHHSLNDSSPKVSPRNAVTTVLPSPPTDPDFLWRQIKPAERCETCGKQAVEYKINDIREKQILRRCKSCFEKMRRQFAKAVWRHVEENQ